MTLTPARIPRRAAAAVALVSALVAGQARAMGFGSGSSPAPKVLAYAEGQLAAPFTAPQRVVAGAAGELYVVDARGGQLSILTPRGEVKGQIWLPDPALAVAPGPSGPFVSTVSGRVFVVDPVEGRVRSELVLAGGPAVLPVALAFDPGSGLLWIAERSAARIRAVRADGSTAMVLAAAGSTRLSAPVDVAIDPAAKLLWVLMQSNEAGPALHAFTLEGAWVRSHLGFGSGLGRLTRGGGLAVGGDGRVYVTDMFQGTVQVLSSAGAALGVIGTFGAGDDGLRQPCDAALLSNGDVVVASVDAGRLQRFGNGAALPSCSGDADCDGIPDGLDPNPLYAGDAFLDSDGDGLGNSREIALGTDPRRADTDGDGHSDGEELASGYDPRDPHDHKPRLLASPPKESDPGLVRFSASVTSASPCRVAWRQIAGPEVTLRGAASLAPSFVGRHAAVYRFEGVASCEKGVSDPAVLEATIREVAPRPDAGRMPVVRAGTPLVLDGGFSWDANGGGLAFAWEQVLGRPIAGSSDGPTLPLDAAEPGLLAFQLTVTDAAGGSASAEVPVLVVDGGRIAPTAAVSSPVFAQAGDTVTLDASGSAAAGGNVRYAWRQVAGPGVSLAGASSATPSFLAPEPGRLEFEVSVAMGNLVSPAARVEVYVAEAGRGMAEARIAAPARADVGEPLELDGSGSAAPDGRELSYHWRQVSGPAAGLTDAGEAVATVVPFEPGSYVFELWVSDGVVVSAPARARFEASRPGGANPVAVASAPGTAVANQLVVLDGTASRGDGPLRHRWTQVAGPWVELAGAIDAIASFRPRAAGVYAFELEVDDGRVRSAPSTVSVMVFPNGNREGDR